MADIAERVSRLPWWKQALFAATPTVVTLVIVGTVCEVALRAHYEKVGRITGAAERQDE